MTAPLDLDALAPDRVLLLGDTHGNSAFTCRAVDTARANGCPVVVQLGDFGFWAHTDDGVRFLADVARACDDDVTFLFVDGNHENHDLLNAVAARVGHPDAVTVAPNVHWLRRGTRWTWHGVRFAALGGAASVDRPRRFPGTSWWDAEVLTPSDVDRLGSSPLDVLLCHDNPSAAAFEGWYPVTPYDQRRCDASRGLLDAAIAVTTPRLVVHGHWHDRRTWEATHADGSPWRIESFAHDGLPADAQAVLSLPELRIDRVR